MKAKLAATGGAPAQTFVDDVFSTYLYTGNGSTQTITNGIDLAGKGGLVWVKTRSAGSLSHSLNDTARGAGYSLSTNNTLAQSSFYNDELTAFNSTGFTLGADVNQGIMNLNAATYASWAFRKAAKFFDVVTYTGTGSARTIAHSLGVAPGMIIVKRTDTTSNWRVYHIDVASGSALQLNTDNYYSASTAWNSTAPTSSVFSVGTDTTVNASGGTYVAYLFAHDTSSNGIIQCGSYTANGSANGPVVTLGWEPQYILIKCVTSSGTNWQIIDSMRGMPVGSADATIQANLTNAESSVEYLSPTATGFQITSANAQVNASGPYIYMAIRRPNKPPTSGTQVYNAIARTGTGAAATVTGGQTDDAVLIKNRGAAVADLFSSRLTGTGYLVTSNNAGEAAAGATILQANPWDVMDGLNVGTTSTITNAAFNTYINYFFKRAPGFFDEVCYTGTGVATTQAHNLTVVPELMIVKSRSNANDWWVYDAIDGNTKYSILNSAGIPVTSSTAWGNTTPTASVFSIGTATNVNASAQTFVAYLFATLAGISKVGSYTGNGTGQAIACGFSAGARFVLIKRTDSTGDWYTFDSARGLTSGSSPYWLLNGFSAAEVTGNNGVYASTGGFTLGSTASTTTNINAATYIFLAVT